MCPLHLYVVPPLRAGLLTLFSSLQEQLQLKHRLCSRTHNVFTSGSVLLSNIVLQVVQLSNASVMKPKNTKIKIIWNWKKINEWKEKMLYMYTVLLYFRNIKYKHLQNHIIIDWIYMYKHGWRLFIFCNFEKLRLLCNKRFIRCK